MLKIVEILKSWIISLEPGESQIDLARERAKTCDSCVYKSELGSSILSNLIPEDQILNKFKCGKCGCPLAKKIFSPINSCPEKKWIK